MTLIDCSNLAAEMARHNISKKDLAECTGHSVRTIHSRFAGKTQWLYEDCIAIREKFFPDMSLEYLFKSEGKQD